MARATRRTESKVGVSLSSNLADKMIQMDIWRFPEVGVRGTPKSSILMGFSFINHTFRGTPIYGTPHISMWIIRFLPCEELEELAGFVLSLK